MSKPYSRKATQNPKMKCVSQMKEHSLVSKFHNYTYVRNPFVRPLGQTSKNAVELSNLVRRQYLNA